MVRCRVRSFQLISCLLSRCRHFVKFCRMLSCLIYRCGSVLARCYVRSVQWYFLQLAQTSCLVDLTLSVELKPTIRADTGSVLCPQYSTTVSPGYPKKLYHGAIVFQGAPTHGLNDDWLGRMSAVSNTSQSFRKEQTVSLFASAVSTLGLPKLPVI